MLDEVLDGVHRGLLDRPCEVRAYKSNSSGIGGLLAPVLSVPARSPSFLINKSCAISIVPFPELAMAFCAKRELCRLIGGLAPFFIKFYRGLCVNKGWGSGLEMDSRKASMEASCWLSEVQ